MTIQIMLPASISIIAIRFRPFGKKMKNTFGNASCSILSSQLRCRTTASSFLPAPHAASSLRMFGLGLAVLCAGMSAPLRAAEDAALPLLAGVENFRLGQGEDAALSLPLLTQDRGDGTTERYSFSTDALAAQPAPGTLPPDHAGPQNLAVARAEPSYRSFGSQVDAVKWEMAGILAYYTAINGTKLFKDPEWPHFHKEGWFGKSTNNLGMDKLAHSYSTYVVSEIIHARLKRKTGSAPGIQFTAAALASATMLYTEIWDSIEPSAGWSWEDVAFNSLGAGFSILRNSVPKLDEKLDFRLMIVPHSGFISTEGKRHFEQQRYFLALKFSGFERVNKGPLRFLELHAGYYAKDFTLRDRELGIEPKRRIFVGVGINLRELFFRDSSSRVGRAIGEGLDYLQPPYTAIHHHLTN